MKRWWGFNRNVLSIKGNQKQSMHGVCEICGKPVYKGNICGSCKHFIDIKKREEGATDHGKYRS